MISEPTLGLESYVSHLLLLSCTASWLPGRLHLGLGRNRLRFRLMAQERIRLGELLVQSNLISREQLDEILAVQKQDGRRLGTLIVERGLVSEFNVTQLLGQQLSVPWVALQHIDFSPELLTLVPVDLAERFCVIPIYVRRVRGLGNVLYVAMDDPTNQQAIDEVSKQAGLPVRTMIAPPSHIRDALHGFYGVGEPVDEDLLAMTPAIIPSLQPNKKSLNPDGTSKPPAPPSTEASVAKLRLQWNEFLARAQPGAPALTIKLAGGKALRISVPAAEGQFAELPITAELSAALTAAAARAGAKEEPGVTRGPDWQTLFGSLIAALVQAGVVVDLKVVNPDSVQQAAVPPTIKY